MSHGLTLKKDNTGLLAVKNSLIFVNQQIRAETEKLFSERERIILFLFL